ncbi:hypothetical protein TWF281_010453 [Arthrobotrys megalospora]
MADSAQQEEVYVEEVQYYDPAPVPKRIVILCDGTSQSAVSGKKSSPSNIARLARSLFPTAPNNEDPRKDWIQVVWYDSGVGTTSGKVGKAVEGAFGNGLEGNVIEAYNFIVLNYNPGDQIFCFGFSRGAYTARSIAGLVSDIGICGPAYLHEFPELWSAYTDTKKRVAGERFCGSQAYFDFIDGEIADARLQPERGPDQDEFTGYNYYEFNWNQKPHYWLEDIDPASRKVELVGVYDTVGSLGMPGILHYHPFGNGQNFHNVELNRYIRRAFHALALDEHRDAFSPTLYSVPTEIKKSEPEDIEQQERLVGELREKWFATVCSRDTSPDEKAKLRKSYIDARKILLELRENALDGSELKQVWFPGMHINTGGGSSDTLEAKGDLEQTANIAFAWMLDQISDYLSISWIQVFDDNKKVNDLVVEHNHRVELAQRVKKLDEEAAKKESWAQATRRLGRYMSSVVTYPFAAAVNDKILPEPGWATGDHVDSYTPKYYLNGSTLRTPGNYNKNPSMVTNEEVHPTVGYRLQKLGKNYKPLPDKNGNGTVHRQKTKDGQRWEYNINGTILPEYKLMPPGSGSMGWCYERRTISQDAKEYVRQLDKFHSYPGWDVEEIVPKLNLTYGQGAVL